MGGNAIKTIPLVRISKEEYPKLEKDILRNLDILFPNQNKFTIPYYKNKKDFGDIDIIVEKPKPITIRSIISMFNTREIHVNSDVISFEYKNFQVDLIFTSTENLLTSVFYFSYNDLNNLVGRFAHKFNLKFGHDGLSYVQRNKNESSVGKIFLTKEPREMYEFLDYDYDRYLEGFDEIEDVFNFVCSSKYFNADTFEYENLNHQNRTRNKKRKTYAMFLDWLKDSEYSNKKFEFNKDKDTYLEIINDYFPKSNLIEKIRIFKENEERISKVKDKFSGFIIMKLIPNLVGAELGVFINDFKNKFIDIEDFYRYIEVNEQEDINQLIISSYNLKQKLFR